MTEGEGFEWLFPDEVDAYADLLKQHPGWPPNRLQAAIVAKRHGFDFTPGARAAGKGGVAAQMTEVLLTLHNAELELKRLRTVGDPVADREPTFGRAGASGGES